MQVAVYPKIKRWFFIVLIFDLLGCFRASGQSYLPSGLLKEVSIHKRENRFDEALARLSLFTDTTSYGYLTGPVLEAEIMKADILRMKGQYQRSADILDSILVLVTQSEILWLEAQLYTVKGTLLLTRGELMRGRAAVLSAINLYLKCVSEDDTLLAPCYNKLGNYYYFIKNYDSAMHWYSRALEINEKKRNNLEERASYLQNIGIVYNNWHDYRKAEEYFHASLILKEAIYSQDNPNLGRLYLNLGRYYENLCAYDKAKEYISKAESIFSKDNIPVTLELGSIFWNKGLIYHLTGESELALTYLFKAKTIIDSAFNENQLLIASLYMDIAGVYKYAENFDRAILFYNKSLIVSDTILEKKALRNLANLYHLQGDLEKAGEYFTLLLNASRNTLHQSNVDNGLNFLYYGYYLLCTDNDNALDYLNKSFEIFNQNESFHNKDVAASLIVIADYYRYKKQYGQSLQYYQKSLSAIYPFFSDTNVMSNPDVTLQSPDIKTITTLTMKAHCLTRTENEERHLDYLVAAANTYNLCFDQIDLLRMSLKAETSRMLLQFKSAGIYKEAIDNCFVLHDLTKESRWLEQAFQIAERSRSMVLLSELKDVNAKKSWLVPESVTKSEKEIRRNINLYRNNILEEENRPYPDENKLDYLRSNLFILEKKHDSLRAILERDFRDYYNYRYDYSVVSVKDVQKILEKNETIIEYAFGEKYIYIFLITEKQFLAKKTEIDRNLSQDIFNLRDNLDFDHVMEYNYEAYMKYQFLAFKLYSALINPVSEYLKNNKLIIIADEELNYLSFESLLSKITPSDTITFRNLPYLLKLNPVSYAPSSTILTLIKKGRMPELERGVLALAPSSDINTRGMSLSPELLQELSKYGFGLPGAVHETETILKVMPGKKLVGVEATESEFKKLAGDFDILHFATHTSIDDENPLSSVLSFYPDGDQNDDGMLHTYEIYNMDLKGELAVLSACSTGSGKLQKGEGVISLARAFTYAGMPSVVMTLWDVEDISTGNIIPYFYYSLGQGVAKDIALRQAKLKYFENVRPEIEYHPAFWSGFVLYGNNRGFRQKPDHIFPYLIIALGGTIILISFVLIRKYIYYRKKPANFDIDIPSKFRSEDRF